MSAKSSPLAQGRFGRMFRTLPPATYGRNDGETLANLALLGTAMSAGFDGPHDGKDDEESGIPALYTYLGQFVDHDITFDPASSLQKQNDPDALVDFRTPAFDLDNVYGRGPDDQPYLYDSPKTFLLGSPIQGGASNARDLPRNGATPSRALIGDPRNDENTIVSQLQGLFLNFHNRMAADNASLTFPDLQRLVRFHYQYMLLHDFLPRIVHSSVLKALKGDHGRYDHGKLKYFHWKHEPFMPVEFSVAAYRLGHSMVRPGYRLNDNDATLLPIFPVPSQGLPNGLTGFQAMDPARGIDWGRFIDVDIRSYDGTGDVNKKRLQLAYRIDTSVVNPLAALPPEVASNPASLPQRNLERAWRLGLPTGQNVARAMCIEPLKDEQIMIGKAIEGGDPDAKNILKVSKVFAGNCPLWTYILAEAALHQESVKIPVKENINITSPRLGPVGGRILAEVFLGLMFGDKNSMLNLDPDFQPPKFGAKFALKDFVNYAIGN
jgi:hypothetical protein